MQQLGRYDARTSCGKTHLIPKHAAVEAPRIELGLGKFDHVESIGAQRIDQTAYVFADPRRRADGMLRVDRDFHFSAASSARNHRRAGIDCARLLQIGLRRDAIAPSRSATIPSPA